MNPKVRAWIVDAAERVGATFAESFLASFSLPALYALADGHIDWSAVRIAEQAGLAAVLALVKAAVAAKKTQAVSPASLAPKVCTLPDARPFDRARVERLRTIRRDYTRERLDLLPKPSGRKHGALPSPPDRRDFKAKLPRLSSIPASVNYGLGLVFGMLLNDILGCCYPAALLHAFQVLTGGKYTPTNADVLAVYEAMGYDPTKTKPDGSNPTDRGTVGRVLFAWALHKGLIASYAAVPTDRASIKAAIAAHKAVLCEWALPVGAENEGAKWTMPRANKAAGSWGYHATVEVGYTPRHNDNVTWGEEGTVTPPFEDAYLQAAWVVEVTPGTDIAGIMAKVRAA